MSGPEKRFWPTRLRWRLRGAWMWPTFFAATLAEGLFLHLLPPIRTGVELIPAWIIATFANLILVIAGLALARLARERADRAATPEGPPPQAVQEVTANRAGTALILAGLAGVLVAGVAARPVVVSETEQTEENARIVRDIVLASGNRELIRNLETANTIRLREGYFRTCIARDERDRYFCMFVDTAREPPDVRRDPSAEPNSVYKAR